MNKIKYRKDIDALRGVAVLLVVIYHAFPSVLTGGFIGVDVFFVISGYLITNIIYTQCNNGDFSFLDFYKRRIRRIFPALLFVLFVSLILGWLVLFPDEYQRLGKHVYKATLFWQNFSLIDEIGYFDVSSHYKPLLHLWTLSIEEQYYFLWPLILFVIIKLKLSPMKVILSIILISFILNIYFVKDYANAVFFHSFTRFWELGFGSLLGIYLYNTEETNLIERHGKVFLILGFFLIITSSFLITSKLLYPYWVGLFPTIGTVLIILANVSITNWFGLVKIGLISYPLYLWHWVIISFLYIYVGGVPSTKALLISILMSFFIAYLTYNYIERIRYIKSDKIVLILILTAIGIGCVGYYIKSEKGIPTRPHVKKIGLQFRDTVSKTNECRDYVASFFNGKRQSGFCRKTLRSGDRKLIAIIGDSHSHVLYPGISKVADYYNYDTIILGRSSCPVMLNFTSSENKDEIDECQQVTKSILKYLKEDKKIDKVLFVTRGPYYIHGETKGQFTEKSIIHNLSKNSTPNNTYENYLNSLKKSLDEINKINHIDEIYYMTEVPELDFHPKVVTPRPFDYFNISTKYKGTVSRKLHDLRVKKYKKMIGMLDVNYPNLTIINSENYMCDEVDCFSYKYGVPLYKDDDHLSIYGSNYLAESVKNIIFK